MKKHALFLLFSFLMSIGCTTADTKNNREKWKSEIIQVEKNFNDMAQDKGLTAAFHHFAATDGVIKRQNKIVKGKVAIQEWYKNDVQPNETLTWKPTFVEVSSAGDLAYTYGNFIFTSIDSSGTKKENKGIFHTVWKRQSNGEWKFVWD